MSREYLLDATPQALVIGPAGIAEIEQNIRLIIATMAFGVRMDCPFAGTGSYIDSPLPIATARRIAEVTDSVERYEPRVQVISVTFANRPEAAVQGQLYPTVRYTLKEGVDI